MKTKKENLDKFTLACNDFLKRINRNKFVYFIHDGGVDYFRVNSIKRISVIENDFVIYHEINGKDVITKLSSEKTMEILAHK